MILRKHGERSLIKPSSVSRPQGVSSSVAHPGESAPCLFSFRAASRRCIGEDRTGGAISLSLDELGEEGLEVLPASLGGQGGVSNNNFVCEPHTAFGLASHPDHATGNRKWGGEHCQSRSPSAGDTFIFRPRTPEWPFDRPSRHRWGVSLILKCPIQKKFGGGEDAMAKNLGPSASIFNLYDLHGLVGLALASMKEVHS